MDSKKQQNPLEPIAGVARSLFNITAVLSAIGLLLPPGSWPSVARCATNANGWAERDEPEVAFTTTEFACWRVSR
ncbi:hypothetical protein [Saccharopolyspora spinosa]|uniref:Uncharacterized protein n=1 Tax=Saccharopolyspora spinosa TaxID=60894 RepID=A0A2N3Y4P5_SACSN|nr:hypothetical protein [Saccharopolyspora spinosa]PKW17880.1 hypothetical protein A8926_5905 [Saccharopolyspora spinosa]